ncbi:MAG TPA: cytochrome c [Candidatus Tectomicrobia bacterium]|nr:cytochrome c [Candidatus Tectomicrobia bacterium]
MRALLAAAVVSVAACAGPADDPLEARGRQVYLSQCVQCHAADPAQAGAVGPPVADASRALLEAKVVRGEYPAGYSPKRPTTVMPPMPQLAPEIDALAAYLDRR